MLQGTPNQAVCVSNFAAVFSDTIINLLFSDTTVSSDTIINLRNMLTEC